MITEKIGSYFLFVQGFRGARLIDSERVLRDLRGSFGGVDLQLLRGDRVAGGEENIFFVGEAGDSFFGKAPREEKLSVGLLFFSFLEHQIVLEIKLVVVVTSR